MLHNPRLSSQLNHSSFTSDGFGFSRETESDIPSRMKGSLNVSKISDTFSEKAQPNYIVNYDHKRNINDFVIIHNQSNGIQNEQLSSHFESLYEIVPQQFGQNKEKYTTQQKVTPTTNFSFCKPSAHIPNLAKETFGNYNKFPYNSASKESARNFMIGPGADDSYLNIIEERLFHTDPSNDSEHSSSQTTSTPTHKDGPKERTLNLMELIVSHTNNPHLDSKLKENKNNMKGKYESNVSNYQSQKSGLKKSNSQNQLAKNRAAVSKGEKENRKVVKNPRDMSPKITTSKTPQARYNKSAINANLSNAAKRNKADGKSLRSSEDKSIEKLYSQTPTASSSVKLFNSNTANNVTTPKEEEVLNSIPRYEVEEQDTANGEYEEMIGYLNSVIKKLIIKTDMNSDEIHKLREIKRYDSARIKLYQNKLNHMITNYVKDIHYETNTLRIYEEPEEEEYEEETETTEASRDIEDNPFLKKRKEIMIDDLTKQVEELQKKLEVQTAEFEKAKALFEELNKPTIISTKEIMTESSDPQTFEMGVQTTFRDLSGGVPAVSPQISLSQISSNLPSCKRISFPKIRGLKTTFGSHVDSSSRSFSS